MSDEYAKHESEVIEEYQKKGYTNNFRIADGRLISSENKKDYAPGDLLIKGENRFEGMSNPDDLSILYAIEAKDGTKGTLLTAYGPNADVEAYEFIEKIPEMDEEDMSHEPNSI